MKSIKIFLFLILLSTISTFGQDYQTISSNRIAYFDNEYNNIKCIRIDSIKHLTDSVFFPLTNFQRLDDQCFSPFVASWIGRSVMIKDNGLNEFINKMGDTISVKTNAKTGDKWLAYAIQDSLSIEATILNHDTLTFLGITDSVKTIGFQAYDNSMNPLDMEINDMNLQISKSHGFVKIFNFYLFPNFEVWDPPEKFEEYSLIGLSNPKIGVDNLTWLEVKDFQVGDELHVLYESSCWWFPEGGGYSETNKAIYRYLERIDYSDSIFYRYSRKQSIYTTWENGSDFKYYDDTLTTTIRPDSWFDKLPGEPIVNEGESYNYEMTNESPVSKTKPSKHRRYNYSGDTCWGRAVHDGGCLPNYKYIKGLGGPYYGPCMHDFCLGSDERRLAYYIKGGVSWGNPLTVTGISHVATVKNITVYPNPAKNHVNITFSNSNYQDLHISIYDIQGKLQKTRSLQSNNSMISISDLNSGIYILKIADNEKILKVDKLVIE